MIKLLRITKLSWIAFLVALCASFIMAASAHAQSASSSATSNPQKYGVTFPIVQLGGCKDYNECRSYCDDPVNVTTCINFAKAKGFYKEDALSTQKAAVLAKAKATLGCDSETSCLNFCQIPANYDKCSTFAQSNNLQGGVIQKADNGQILEKAKQVLGCTSVDSCKSLCSDSANKQKCADFAKQTGLRGGEQKIGPGGCTSEETCRTFCSDPGNYQICADFVHSLSGTFSGPGGCNSPESCKTYCQQNPSACSSFGGTGSQGGFNPAETCNRTPNCSWTGVTCYCGNANTGTNSNGQAGPDNAAATCVRYGCIYTGNSCQCQNIGNTYNLDAAKQGCELAKGTWTGSYCNMSSGNSPYSGGASYQQQEAVCKSGGGTCAAGSTANFCNCQGYQAPQYSPYPQSSSSSQNYNSQYSCASTVCSNGYAPDPGKNCACIPTGNPASGSYSYSQQEAMCRSGGGTCASGSTSTYCNCQGYQGIPAGSTANPAPASCQPPSAGCGPGGSWDQARCGCYGSTSTTTPTSGSCPSGQFWNGSSCVIPTTPAPGSCQSPAGGCGPNSYYDYSRCGCYQNNQTAPQPTTAAPASTTSPSTPAPSSSPAVHGISTTRSLLESILDWFK